MSYLFFFWVVVEARVGEKWNLKRKKIYHVLTTAYIHGKWRHSQALKYIGEEFDCLIFTLLHFVVS